MIPASHTAKITRRISAGIRSGLLPPLAAARQLDDLGDMLDRSSPEVACQVDALGHMARPDRSPAVLKYNSRPVEVAS